MDRRRFLQATSALTAGAMLKLPLARADEATKGAPHAEKLGWRLGCQAWTFNKFTLFEAIDKTAELGLKYIEAFPHGQKLSPTDDTKFEPKLSTEKRTAVKQYLA